MVISVLVGWPPGLTGNKEVIGWFVIEAITMLITFSGLALLGKDILSPLFCIPPGNQAIKRFNHLFSFFSMLFISEHTQT